MMMYLVDRPYPESGEAVIAGDFSLIRGEWVSG